MPVFCPLNGKELIILGGKSIEYEPLSDGWIFDTRTDTVQQVIHPSEFTPKFYTLSNQHHMVQNDMIIADALNVYRETDFLIEFSKGSDRVIRI